MMMFRRTGADRICSTLERLGVKHVFGVPGTQNVGFFEALRKSNVRVIVPTHELAAAFMAGAYFRSSGHVGVMTTIPGPGFAFTIAGLAEAAHDSAALIYLLAKPRLDRPFDLQAMDQAAILAPVVKAVIDLDHADDIEYKVHEAYLASMTGEPGPVVLHYDSRVMDSEAPVASAASMQFAFRAGRSDNRISEVAALLAAAARPLLLVGQGVNAHGDLLRELVVRLGALVAPTRSARGVVPESNPLCLTFEQNHEGAARLNGLLEQSDCILALGCKLSHNGSYGFKLRLNPEHLIHVDSSAETLQANYPASLAIQMDAGEFLAGVLGQCERKSASTWQSENVDTAAPQSSTRPEPCLPALTPSTPAAFFAALRSAMPEDAILVTDSGMHQVLATRHFRVLGTRGFLIPSDFQSMGFGLPAALAAKLANPGRRVVALIGDGGLLMSGMELATAVRERLAVTVIVFNDKALGQIKTQQHAAFGRSSGTELFTPSLEAFAQSLGVQYLRLGRTAAQELTGAIACEGVTLVEVEVAVSRQLQLERMKGLARNVVRQTIGGRTRRRAEKVRPIAIGQSQG